MVRYNKWAACDILIISDLIFIVYGILFCEYILYITFLDITVMCHMMMFRSVTHCIYSSGTIRL